jgi:type IV pilus assembly protein PilB
LRLARLVDPAGAAGWTFYRGEGCSKCGNTGFRGRTAIFEFMEVTDPVREMILDGTGTVALRKKAIEDGMETLFVNGMGKVKLGVTTVSEVLGVAPLSDSGA